MRLVGLAVSRGAVKTRRILFRGNRRRPWPRLNRKRREGVVVGGLCIKLYAATCASKGWTVVSHAVSAACRRTYNSTHHEDPGEATRGITLTFNATAMGVLHQGMVLTCSIHVVFRGWSLHLGVREPYPCKGPLRVCRRFAGDELGSCPCRQRWLRRLEFRAPDEQGAEGVWAIPIACTHPANADHAQALPLLSLKQDSF